MNNIKKRIYYKSMDFDSLETAKHVSREVSKSFHEYHHVFKVEDSYYIDNRYDPTFLKDL